MSDAPEPPRKTYGFKPTEFLRVNHIPGAPSDGTAGAPSPPDSGPIDVRTIAREAQARLPARILQQGRTGEKTEIHALLRENHERAHSAGLNDVNTRPRRSRRRHDYIYTLLIGNTVLIGGTFLMPVFGGAGLVIFNVSVTWIMWFVMDDY
jgi:hypothetical protein